MPPRLAPVAAALVIVAAAAAATPHPAAAFEPREGCLVAAQACPASPSLKGDAGSSAVRLEAGQSYRLIGANKEGAEATHLQVRVPTAQPSDRWVEVSCGRTVARCDAPGVGGGGAAAAAAAPKPAPAPVPGASVPAGPAREYVLSVSWQPAFCEGHRRKPECRGQNGQSFDATNLTLHGLWPQDGEWCGVSASDKRLDQASRWDELPAVELSPATRRELERVMPGTASGLDRHEWLRHGTCHGGPAEDYFREALSLLREVNGSPLRDLLASKVGRQVTSDEIRAAFADGFGARAGDKVGVVCEGQGRPRLISELRISLKGRVGPGARLADLLASAPPAREGCPGGKVDAAGFGR